MNNIGRLFTTQRVKVYLCKHKSKVPFIYPKHHLIYLINDKIWVLPYSNGIHFVDNTRENRIFIRKLKDFIDFIDMDVSLEHKPYKYLLPNLYTCVSLGKQILGVRGIFLSPRGFFNFLKRKDS
jgi:hypothetical protein